MKRLLLALAILMVGTTVFCAFQHSTAELRRELAANREAWLTQTQLVALARVEHNEITERVRELKRSFPAQPRADDAEAARLMVIATNGSPKLSPAQREHLLAELGFNWNTTGNYLVVSKETLRRISLSGMKDVKPTDTACSILAVTPEERAAVEGEAQRLRHEYASWAQAHAQREEPSGDVVAKYRIPADAAFSESCSNAFTSRVLAALGQERGGLFLNYASEWMSDMGMYGGEATTMTVKRSGTGNEARLNVEVRRSGSVTTTGVSPYQFPGPFRALFPNGWPDVAKREGFELPKEFEKMRQQ